MGLSRNLSNNDISLNSKEKNINNSTTASTSQIDDSQIKLNSQLNNLKFKDKTLVGSALKKSVKGMAWNAWSSLNFVGEIYDSIYRSYNVITYNIFTYPYRKLFGSNNYVSLRTNDILNFALDLNEMHYPDSLKVINDHENEDVEINVEQDLLNPRHRWKTVFDMPGINYCVKVKSGYSFFVDGRVGTTVYEPSDAMRKDAKEEGKRKAKCKNDIDNAKGDKEKIEEIIREYLRSSKPSRLDKVKEAASGVKNYFSETKFGRACSVVKNKAIVPFFKLVSWPFKRGYEYCANSKVGTSLGIGKDIAKNALFKFQRGFYIFGLLLFPDVMVRRAAKNIVKYEWRAYKKNVMRNGSYPYWKFVDGVDKFIGAFNHAINVWYINREFVVNSQEYFKNKKENEDELKIVKIIRIKQILDKKINFLDKVLKDKNISFDMSNVKQNVKKLLKDSVNYQEALFFVNDKIDDIVGFIKKEVAKESDKKDFSAVLKMLNYLENEIDKLGKVKIKKKEVSLEELKENLSILLYCEKVLEKKKFSKIKFFNSASEAGENFNNMIEFLTDFSYSCAYLNDVALTQDKDLAEILNDFIPFIKDADNQMDYMMEISNFTGTLDKLSSFPDRKTKIDYVASNSEKISKNVNSILSFLIEGMVGRIQEKTIGFINDIQKLVLENKLSKSDGELYKYTLNASLKTLNKKLIDMLSGSEKASFNEIIQIMLRVTNLFDYKKIFNSDEKIDVNKNILIEKHLIHNLNAENQKYLLNDVLFKFVGGNLFYLYSQSDPGLSYMYSVYSSGFRLAHEKIMK